MKWAKVNRKDEESRRLIKNYAERLKKEWKKK
jgi:hypothetical protein